MHYQISDHAGIWRPQGGDATQPEEREYQVGFLEVATLKLKDDPWLVWFSGWSVSLRTKGLMVRFPV